MHSRRDPLKHGSCIHDVKRVHNRIYLDSSFGSQGALPSFRNLLEPTARNAPHYVLTLGLNCDADQEHQRGWTSRKLARCLSNRSLEVKARTDGFRA